MAPGSHRRFAAFLVLALFLSALPANLRPAAATPQSFESVQPARTQANADPPIPVTSHPRLWLTQDDLPRLRGWATDANPIWRDGMIPLIERMTADMDTGAVPGQDDGLDTYQAYPTESYAEFFAFLSLVDPDEAARADYADRARTLLMYAINEAAKGHAVGEPFRDPEFVVPFSDRLRWYGESWALTVDWIYPSLTDDDKATIREVFLRWSDEIVNQGYNHPDPIGVTNDPILTSSPLFRWSGNNYFTSHMRNIGLMALALDPEDDPGGELGAYLGTAIGAHLYMTDQLLRTDSAGGLAPEGFEYSPQTLAYVTQFLLALHTAGQDDPAKWGPQVLFEDNPFWDQVIPAYLHSLSPQTTILPGVEAYGEVYQPAWYGDGEIYLGPDMIALLGSMGRYDELTGNTERLDAIRWIQTHTPPGGAEMLAADRVAYANGLGSPVNAILYFMLFDPDAPPAADPHSDIPLFHFAPGIGRFFARTSWDEDAAWFTYGLGWVGIDHQNADGNTFAFYRNGEWLTKGLVGYGGEYGDDDPSDDFYYPSSDQQNSLGLENDSPFSNVPTDYRSQLYTRGSQWEYVPAGDPTILALSVAPGYAYALGDATNLYNSTDEGSTDIVEATRSIIWLAPDVIVVYDRAASKTDGRFKRFWLNLPADATVAGTTTTMATDSGQHLVIDTLLPAGAVPVVRLEDSPVDTMAAGEPMRYEYLVEAPGDPQETRFLNVLQGTDAGAEPATVASLESADGAFVGTVVGTTAILFPVDLGAEPGEIQYTAPAGTETHLITGLTPGGGYDVETNDRADGIDVDVRISTGDDYQADDGGVLLIGTLTDSLGTSDFAFTSTQSEASDGSTPDATEDDTGVTDAPGDQGDDEGILPDVTVPPLFGDDETADDEDGDGDEDAETGVGGDGQVTFEAVPPGSETRRIYRVDAIEGATPEDLTRTLDEIGPAAIDDWLSISPDGEWLLLGTERFDPDCAGWPCLAVVSADLSRGESVRTSAGVIHPDGFGTISSGGNLIVYHSGGGPHPLDLWAVTRDGNTWTDPLLLTDESLYDYNHTASISADGARIVFDCGDLPYAGEGTAICEVSTDGSDFQVLLTPDDAPSGVASGGALHHPDYAPNGDVVFQATWSGEIWRLPQGGNEPEPVSADFAGEGAPCVLGDGRIASIWTGQPGNDGMPVLKVMTPDGADFVVLVSRYAIEDIGCGG